MTSSSILSTQRAQRRFHTPTTYRAQRRLQFPATASSNLQQRRIQAARQFDDSLSNNDDAQRDDENDENNLRNEAETPTDDSNAATTSADNQAAASLMTFSQTPNVHERILPWNFNGNNHTKLYSTTPPKLSYPSGSRDKTTNNRFITRMNMYLNRNFLVRSAISGVTPHPFSNYDRLKEYWRAIGTPNRTFDTKETFATLQEIKDKGHLAFLQELNELLWFGGIVSYGNIMAEVYTIIYDWIDPSDLQDVEGLCETNDGITFHKVIVKSLQTIRPQHTQEIINGLYDDLDNVKLIMRPGGMAGFFAQIKKHKLKLKQKGQEVTDAYLIRRTTMATQSKHPKLAEVIAQLRRFAGTSGNPTTFLQLQDCLTDTFDFEVPDKDKNETPPPAIPANSANTPRGGDEPPARKKTRYTRKVFPKGSCTNHPDATNHTTARCWITVRKKKGLPAGFQWCLIHKTGIHYDHLCRRHAPNYPPVPGTCPTIPGATAATNNLTPEQLKDQLLAMFSDTKTNGITITKGKNHQSFQPARNISTNVATNGPPVNQIATMILNLEPNMCDELQQTLAQSGL